MTNKRILVIDDDKFILKSFQRTLEDEGFPIDIVESGEQGIEMCKKTKYNLIYLDLKMPGIDGVETLREIRKIDSKAPIYIVTAFHKDYFEQLQGVIDDGIKFELLKKPLNSDQICTVTKQILKMCKG